MIEYDHKRTTQSIASRHWTERGAERAARRAESVQQWMASTGVLTGPPLYSWRAVEAVPREELEPLA